MRSVRQFTSVPPAASGPPVARSKSRSPFQFAVAATKNVNRRASIADSSDFQAKLAKAQRTRDISCPRIRIITLPTGKRRYGVGSHISDHPPEELTRRNQIVPSVDPPDVELSPSPEPPKSLASPPNNASASDGVTEFVEHSICHFSASQFKHYGLGISLYFKMLKKLVAILLVCAVLSIPSIIFCLSAGSSDSSSSGLSFERTMLGNFAASLSTNSSHPDISAVGSTIPKRDAVFILSCFDAAICVFFLLFLYRVHRAQYSEGDAYRRAELTVVHYTVQVLGLPENFCDRMELANFFQQRFGEVADVALVFDDNELLSLYSQRGRLRRELDLAVLEGQPGRLDSIIDRIEDVDRLIGDYRKFSGGRRLIAAYVTFETQESRFKCCRAYSSYWRKFFRRQGAGNVLAFKGRTLNVEQASEPSNIDIRNLQYSRKNKFFRRLITSTITLLTLAVSVAAVFVAHYYQRRTPGEKQCPAGITVDRVNQVGADQDLVNCYCRQLGLTSAIQQNSSPDCSNWVTNFVLGRILSVLSVIVITLINLFLKYFVASLARFEKHSSVTRLQQAITTKLFIGLFLNTAIILLVVNAQLKSYVANLGFTVAFDGEFEDFTHEWFVQVGSSVMLTMILNVANQGLWPFICIGVQKMRRSALCLSQSMNQVQLNRRFAGFRFSLSNRYAALLNTIFVCFMYSAGIPFLLLIAAATIGVTYWLDKSSFLRLYSLPPRFDDALAKYSVHILPYSVLIHLAFALWFFSSPVVISDRLFQTTANSLSYDLLSLQDRLIRWETAPTSILFLILSVFLLFRWLAQLCGGSSDYTERSLSDARNFITFTQAAQTIKFEHYHQYDGVHHDAFIPTHSTRQLLKPLPLKDLRELQIKAAAQLEQEEVKLDRRFTAAEVIHALQSLDYYYSPAVLQQDPQEQRKIRLSEKHRAMARIQAEKNRQKIERGEEIIDHRGNKEKEEKKQAPNNQNGIASKRVKITQAKTDKSPASEAEDKQELKSVRGLHTENNALLGANIADMASLRSARAKKKKKEKEKQQNKEENENQNEVKNDKTQNQSENPEQQTAATPEPAESGQSAEAPFEVAIEIGSDAAAGAINLNPALPNEENAATFQAVEGGEFVPSYPTELDEGGAMPAGAPEDGDYNVLQVPCPSCQRLVQIIDVGEPKNYQCHCGAIFRM